MKTDTVVIVAAAAAAWGLIAWMTRAKGGAPAPARSTPGIAGTLNNGGSVYGVNEIPNTALPGGPGYGWHYYSDGTSISPDGTYYNGGDALYQPTDPGAMTVYINGHN